MSPLRVGSVDASCTRSLNQVISEGVLPHMKAPICAEYAPFFSSSSSHESRDRHSRSERTLAIISRLFFLRPYPTKNGCKQHKLMPPVPEDCPLSLSRFAGIPLFRILVTNYVSLILQR